MAPTTARRTPYKDLLQPALQRRFSTAASILLAIAYAQAVLLGDWSSYFWAWFPIGPAGVKAGFLFLCGLSIIILRIAQYHVGLRTSNSGLQTFAQNALKPQTVEAIVSYGLSSWLFSQVYLWSVPDGANLNWISYHSGDRARLNEKPLFFTTHFLLFGAVRGILHLYKDDDRLLLGTVRARPAAAKQGDGNNLLRRFSEEVPILLVQAATQSIAALIGSALLYRLIFRPIAWRSALLIFRPFYNLPRTNMTPASMPFSVWLLIRCIFAGFMISFVWMAANSAFSIFLVKEPLKNGKPLTSESKDPNGSLLNGLKSKKLSVRCFAMWELAFIARDFDVRRKQIYEDIDRKDGPMWLQVYAICLDALTGIETRIDNYGKAPAPVAPAVHPADGARPASRVSQPVREDPVLVSTPPRKTFRGEMEKAVGQAATAPGQGSRLSPLAKKALSDAKGKLATIKQEATSSSNPDSPISYATHRFLASPAGRPFRQEFGRRLAAAVLGSPYGEASLYINAATALSQLAVHSLQEDRYGNVQRDIATIIRTLTTVTQKVEAFKAAFPMHWTDVEGRKDAPEVDAVLGALRESLAELVTSFGPFSRDLRLGLTDMRLAKEAAGLTSKDEIVPSKPQMREVR